MECGSRIVNCSILWYFVLQFTNLHGNIDVLRGSLSCYVAFYGIMMKRNAVCQTSSLSYIFDKKRATSVRSRTFSKLNDSLRQSYTFSLKNIKVTLWSVDAIVRQLQSFYDGMLDDLGAHMHRHVLCMLSKRVSPDKLVN